MFHLIIKEKKVVWYLVITTLSAILLSLFGIGIPLLLGYLIDNIIEVQNANNLMGWLVIAIIVMVVYKLFSMIFPNYLTFKFEIITTQLLELKLLDQYFKIKNYNYETHSTGKLLNILTTDISAVVGIVFQIVSISINAILIITLYFFILMSISPVISLVIALGMPFYFIAMIINNGRMQRIQIEQAKDWDEYTTTTKYIVEHKKQINLNKAESYFKAQFKKPYDQFIETRLKYWFWHFLSTELPSMVSAVIKYICLFVGAIKVLDGNMTVGSLLVVAAYVDSLMVPLNEIAHIIVRKNSNQVAFERSDTFLIQQENVDGFKEFIGEKELYLRLKHIEIVGKNEEVLFTIEDLKIEKHGIYQLVGENGSGKTSFLNLITNVDSSDFIRSKDTTSIVKFSECVINTTEYMTMPYIFANATVRENILMGKESPMNFEAVINMLGIDFLDKTVRMDNVGLSLGEMAKISLARILLRDSVAIILDEPIANVDVATSQRLVKYLNLIKHDRLIIVVSHDHVFTDISDHVLRIQDKRLVVSTK